LIFNNLEANAFFNASIFLLLLNKNNMFWQRYTKYWNWQNKNRF